MTYVLPHQSRDGRAAGSITAARPGATLIELIVVLAILGLMVAVVGLSFTRAPSAPPPGSIAAALDTIAAVRRMAITRGIPITIVLSIATSPEAGGPSRTAHATAYPDGSVVADGALGIDRLSGRPLAPSHSRDRE